MLEWRLIAFAIYFTEHHVLRRYLVRPINWRLVSPPPRRFASADTTAHAKMQLKLRFFWEFAFGPKSDSRVTVGSFLNSEGKVKASPNVAYYYYNKAVCPEIISIYLILVTKQSPSVCVWLHLSMQCMSCLLFRGFHFIYGVGQSL